MIGKNVGRVRDGGVGPQPERRAQGEMRYACMVFCILVEFEAFWCCLLFENDVDESWLG